MKNDAETQAAGASSILKLPLPSYSRFIYERVSDIILIFDKDGRLKSINPSFERQFGYTREDLPDLTIDKLVQKEELDNLFSTFSKLLESNEGTASLDMHWYARNGELRDLVGRITNLTDDPDIQGFLFIGSDTTEQRRWESILGQYSHRLEVLRKIQIGILQAESPETISKAALDHINSIIPCSMASITLFDSEGKSLHMLAAIGGPEDKPPSSKIEQIEEIQAALKQGDWFEVDDVEAWTGRSPLFQMMALLGIKHLFFIPLLIRGDLIGSLNLAFLAEEVVRLDHLEAAREIADMLALAIQQSHLLESEQQQRQQAELIRDAISSIATSLDFHQIMGDLLTNLRRLVTYDSAHIVLIEENALKVAAWSGSAPEAQAAGGKYSIDNLIFQQMQKIQLPIIISDTLNDSRFQTWESGENTRAWMGVPLISHNGMIGFLSLNSQKTGAFDQVDPVPILVVADHVAVTLENAWLYDETARRAKELSAISRVSTSLRTAQTLEELLDTLLRKTLEMIDARYGQVYRIEGEEIILTAIVGPEKHWLGNRRPVLDDPLFPILSNSNAVILGQDIEPTLMRRWLDLEPKSAKSAKSAFIPLVTTDGPVGLMVLNLNPTTDIDPERRRLLKSIADMASNALYRVMMMGQLEKRVAHQTRDLTVLFEVSSITSQALELKEMLSLALDRILSYTTNSLGAVYQLEAKNSRLRRLVERQYPVSQAGSDVDGNHSSILPEEISVKENGFFAEPFNSGLPHLVLDMTDTPKPPPEFVSSEMPGYLGIPIKNNGRILGMLCLFSKPDLRLNIEQITLLSAVGDQLGVAIDSSRLRQRAAQAAVFEERQRLARDLHDSVTQSIYSLTLLAEGYRRQVPQGSQAEIQTWLADLESVSLQALKEMRLLLYELKPASFKEDGLMNALNRRLQSVETRSGMKVDFHVDPRTVIPVDYQEDLYRIAQEALNNIIKHSGANSVEIKLGSQGSDILLEIQDNGKGFYSETAYNSGGFGLTGMTERAKCLGGTLEIKSNAETGTTVRVLIPGGKP